MVRNRNMDIFRSIALLTVMVYHFWVVTGSFSFLPSPVTTLISLGGEIGVTAFFALSGFGIFCSLKKEESEKQKFSISNYVKRRAIRIIPLYYISILFTLLLINAQSLSVDGVKDILAHIFFIHNIFPQYHGSINGVLWTMGVIVQFYIIAPLLYRAFRAKGYLTEIICIITTCFLKGITYHYFLPTLGLENYSFIYGRQLFTALDNFSTGMFVAWLLYERRMKIKNGIKKCIFFLLTLFLLFLLCKSGIRLGIHTNNISGYIWHSLLAGIIGVLMFIFSQLNLEKANYIVKMFLWISKYEYGIYIWHLLIFNNLIATSSLVKNAVENSAQVLLLIPFLTSAIFCGFLFTKMTDKFCFKSLGGNFKCLPKEK